MDMTDGPISALQEALFNTREGSDDWPKLVAALAALDEEAATTTVASVREVRDEMRRHPKRFAPGALAIVHD